jgi:hypothetical protein
MGNFKATSRAKENSGMTKRRGLFGQLFSGVVLAMNRSLMIAGLNASSVARLCNAGA